MAYSVFPAPSAGGDGGTNIEFFALPDHKFYVSTVDYVAGTYSLAMTTANKTAKAQFFDSNGGLITTANLSGLTPVVINLATPATKVRIFQPYVQSLSGSVTVQIEFKGEQLLASTFSGTVQTITTTQAVNINGTAYVMAVGGGGAGHRTNSHPYGGGGGGSGALVESFRTNWSGAYTATIGAAQLYTTISTFTGRNQGFAGTTTLSDANGVIFSANGGGNGGRGDQDATGGDGGTVSGTYTVGTVGGAGGTGHLNHTGTAYAGSTAAFTNQHAKAGGVQGGMGGWDNWSTAPTNMLNGLAGTGVGASSHATGFGNGGGGYWHNGAAGNGTAGVMYIITSLQEI